MAERKDYYAILGVSVAAQEGEIKKRYRALARRFHPDKIADESEKKDAEKVFMDIAEAYEVSGQADEVLFRVS
jgi:curved DNA-binding protein